MSWLSMSLQNQEFSGTLNFPSVTFPVLAATKTSLSVNMELCSLTGEDRKMLALGMLIEETLGVRE